jgi:hypothetical protein
MYTDCCEVVKEVSVTSGEYLLTDCVKTNTIIGNTATIGTVDYTTGTPCICLTPTPTVTETPTETPTNTPTQTPTPTTTQSEFCECNTYSIEFTQECSEAISWVDCNDGTPMTEQGLYFGLPTVEFTNGTIINVCSCSLPTVGCPSVIITLISAGCDPYYYYAVKEVSDCSTGDDFGETYIVRSATLLSIGEFIQTTITPIPTNCAWKVNNATIGPLYDGTVTSLCGTGIPVVTCCC